MSGSNGLYCGFLIPSEYPINIGTLSFTFSGKNLPNSKFEAKSYCKISSLLRSLTFFSILPKPGVLVAPDNVTIPKSANFADILTFAAQPPFSSKFDNRNSFTHISTHFGNPSSGNLFLFFERFRIPIITVLTLLILGLPTTVIL